MEPAGSPSPVQSRLSYHVKYTVPLGTPSDSGALTVAWSCTDEPRSTSKGDAIAVSPGSRWISVTSDVSAALNRIVSSSSPQSVGPASSLLASPLYEATQ